jgi:Ni,Fe-hydrogenase III component G
VITAVGNEFTVTMMLSESVQPLALVTVTVYVPLADAVMADVVAAFDHRYPVPPEAVSVTDPPWQKVVGASGVITAVGREFTVTMMLSVSVQTVALVTVTVYVPPVVIEIAAVVDELDQR